MAYDMEHVETEEKQYAIQNLENTGSALATITKAEIDVQISTAHAYPRSLTAYRNKAMTMLMMNKEIADECFYVIPRAGKTIEGPSVRLAEIVAASYGNMRSGARVVAEEDEFVVAQGICHDLETNFAVTFEVKRRIVDKNGNRFNSDMIGVTGNAASSIAFRNTVFRVVPKVLWMHLYEMARKVAKGDEKTFEVKREAVLVAFEKLKVKRQTIFEFLGIGGIQDMNSDHIVTLVGIGNAIKSGEAKIEDLYKPEMGRPADGRVVLEKDSPMAGAAAPTGNGAQKPANSGIYIQFNDKELIVSGNTIPLKDAFPKVGARRDEKAGVWRMPASRTHELMEYCEKKQIKLVELDANGNTTAVSAESQREPGQDEELNESQLQFE